MKADNKVSTPSYKWPTDKKTLNKLLKTVKASAEAQATNNQIAASLNIASSTFYLWIKKFPILEQTIQEGRAKGLAEMKSQLYELAINGDTRAICWLLSRYDPELKNSPMNQKLQAEVKKLQAETKLLKLQLKEQKAQLENKNQFVNDQFVFILE